MELKEYRLKNTNIYLIISPENYISEDEFLDDVAKELELGTDIVEIDGRNCNAKKTIAYGKKLRELCSIYNVIFIVRSRADIAHILNADGINLDSEDIDITSAKHLLGNQCIVGYSVYTEKDIESGLTLEPDYLIVHSENFQTCTYINPPVENKNVKLFIPSGKKILNKGMSLKKIK